LAAWDAIQDMISFLRKSLGDCPLSDHIGIARPATKSKLPSIVLSMGGIKESGLGIGKTRWAEKISDNKWIQTTGNASSGIIAIEAWASSEENVRDAVESVIKAVKDSPSGLFEKGFKKFAVIELNPIEKISADSTNMFRMIMKYSVVHEKLTTESIETKGIIHEVDVKAHIPFSKETDGQEEIETEEMTIKRIEK
jgi:hypothetical protein